MIMMVIWRRPWGLNASTSSSAVESPVTVTVAPAVTTTVITMGQLPAALPIAVVVVHPKLPQGQMPRHTESDGDMGRHTTDIVASPTRTRTRTQAPTRTRSRSLLQLSVPAPAQLPTQVARRRRKCTGRARQPRHHLIPTRSQRLAFDQPRQEASHWQPA